MKHTTILALSAIMLLCSSCSEFFEFFKKAEIDVAPAYMEADAYAYELVFDVSANKDWTAETSASWFSVYPPTGSSDDTKLTAKLKANTTDDERTDTIKAVCGEKVTSFIIIKQKGMSSVVSPVNIVLTETAELNITAKNSWTIEYVEPSQAEWFSVSPVSGKEGNAKVTLTTLQDNVFGDDRNARIKITIGGTQFIATVTQKAVTAILETKENVKIGSEGGEFSIKIKSNMSYSVDIPAAYSWIKKTQAKAVKENTEYFYVEKNGFSPRNGEILIVGEATTDTVKVYQAPAEIALTDINIPGIYSKSGKEIIKQYILFEEQIACGQTSDSRYFRIQNYNAEKYCTIGFPSDTKICDKVQVQISQNYVTTIGTSISMEAEVIKIDGSAIWLYNAEEGIGFIVNVR